MNDRSRIEHRQKLDRLSQLAMREALLTAKAEMYKLKKVDRESMTKLLDHLIDTMEG